MDTVQGWHFAETGERFAYKAFSGEKSTHKKRLCPFLFSSFKTEPFILISRSFVSFLGLTSTFYLENHTGLNVPSRKEKRRPKIVWLVKNNKTGSK